MPVISNCLFLFFAKHEKIKIAKTQTKGLKKNIKSLEKIKIIDKAYYRLKL
ncbi:hypothetical protein GCM10011413_38690 [Pedobacter psychrotolerans]|uniref:Uncharacterized protein n=1 Tax=Pedobacter psychrotolerans TaxID=1843235 RepID=A0ABQ1SWE4_9SPHI|nr:hypothetical protein GCM10011413_38690 [Pedobacter psychrotolerans]